ncbi:MAG TPA: hypothetical protein VFX38_07055 [Gammaproteobacteria bacterium]|nr:hypothetical protein [Gammaproteobacteria bacterium]
MTTNRGTPGEHAVRLTVGVTAHRNLLDAEAAGIERLVGELFDGLVRRFPDTPLQALCPLAEGGERIFARAARARGIPLIVPLPLPRDHYVEDFTSDASRREFEDLCRDATVFELPLGPGVTAADVATSGPERDRSYAQLGVFVSSRCQILVAIWDGKGNGQVGGTAQIVQYRLHNIYPARVFSRPLGQEVLADDENDLIFHIACSRDAPDGAPASPLRALESRWLTGADEAQAKRELPDTYARIFDMTAEFNRDCMHAAAPERARLGGIVAADGAWPAGIRHLSRTFALADRLANHFQRRLNFALRSTYTLAVLMGAAFIGYTTVSAWRYLLYGFFGLFALGFCLYEIARRRDWHRKYLDYRVLAEGLRVQCCWAIAGIGNSGDGRFVYENFLQKQDPELGWIRQVMRDAELRTGFSDVNVQDGLDFVRRYWVGGAAAPAGQLGYYNREAQRRYRLHRLTELLSSLCLWSGMIIAIVLGAVGERFSTTVVTILLLLLGLLPLIAAVRSAYSHKRADKELIKQYRFMAHNFRNACRRLDDARDDEERREVLRALGLAALDEHAEWILLHRERPLERSRV